MEKENEIFDLTGNSDKNLISQLKQENTALNLQREYESGNVFEDQLTDTQKKELLHLYLRQIQTLEDTALEYKKKLEDYKLQIIEKRKKMYDMM